MKKIKAPQPIATLPLCNTSAIVISNIDDQGETVSYYLASDADDMVKVHTAKIYYHMDGSSYFNSIVGRMSLENFIKC